MKQPLILLLYERVLPGGQLVNRLQDLGYRVQSFADPAVLLEQSERERPILVMADLESPKGGVAQAISQLRANGGTSHIPVIAFAGAGEDDLLDAGRSAGAKLVVNDNAISLHLEQLLEQALQVD